MGRIRTYFEEEAPDATQVVESPAHLPEGYLAQQIHVFEQAPGAQNH